MLAWVGMSGAVVDRGHGGLNEGCDEGTALVLEEAVYVCVMSMPEALRLQSVVVRTYTSINHFPLSLSWLSPHKSKQEQGRVA